ncbi:unnamed protein product [Boreogadus saida]
MMVEDFRHAGMMACVRERLKIVVKTCESWSAQPLSTFPGIPSGPAAFLGLTPLSTRLTSCTPRVSGGAGKEAAQLLCQCRIRVPGCHSTASVIGDCLCLFVVFSLGSPCQP